jgi:hypothetical protein
MATPIGPNKYDWVVVHEMSLDGCRSDGRQGNDAASRGTSDAKSPNTESSNDISEKDGGKGNQESHERLATER